MEVDFTAMTPEQIEELKPFLYIVAIIPAILIVRFFLLFADAQIHFEAFLFR